MIRHRSQILSVWFVGWDLTLTAAAWVGAYWLRFETGWIPVGKDPPNLHLCLTMLPLVLGLGMDIGIDYVQLQKFNVFEVYQLAPNTFLDRVAGVDYIEIAADSTSELHRHNHSDNVIFVIAGTAVAELNGTRTDPRPGMRVLIPRGTSHMFVTSEKRLRFVSVQIPPILDRAHGKFDRDVIHE